MVCPGGVVRRGRGLNYRKLPFTTQQHDPLLRVRPAKQCRLYNLGQQRQVSPSDRLRAEPDAQARLPARALARWPAQYAPRATGPACRQPMDLAAPLALITVVNGTRTAIARGLQSASVQDNRIGLTLTVLRYAQHRTQIVDHRLEATGVQPTLRLLVDQFPRREVVREHRPRCAGSRYPAQRVEHLAQFVSAPGS